MTAVLSVIVLLILSLTSFQQAGTAQQVSPVAAATAAVCTAAVEGSEKGLAKASLIYSRGNITAYVGDATALELFQGSSKGVSWASEPCKQDYCLLTICGVQGGGLLDLDLMVSGYVDTTESLWGVVCVTGDTKATVRVCLANGSCSAATVMDALA